MAEKSSNYSEIIASPLIHTQFSGLNYDDKNIFLKKNTHLKVNPTRIGAMVSTLNPLKITCRKRSIQEKTETISLKIICGSIPLYIKRKDHLMDKYNNTEIENF